jgi:hypothetical protein
MTGTGIKSGYAAVYIVQNSPFIEIIMSRWTINVALTDFVKYGKMYALGLTYAQLGVTACPCFTCMEFYEHTKSHHYHNRKGGICGTAKAITKNLSLVPDPKNPTFIDNFKKAFNEIHGSSDLDQLGKDYSPGLKVRYNMDRLGSHKYVRIGSSFTTISGLKVLNVDSNYKLAARQDITRNVVNKDDFSEISIDEVKQYYETLTKCYEIYFITPDTPDTPDMRTYIRISTVF